MRKPRKPEIIFEDQHLIVLSKPAGLLSQGADAGEPNLVDWLRDYLRRNYVGLVHRLDRNVSGIMIVAKRTKAADRLTRALQEGRVRRIYLGWILGRLSAETVWKHNLLKDRNTNITKVVMVRHPESREAILKVRPAGYGAWQGWDLTLAEFELETGRSHQIRVQSLAKGFPLLGDEKYSRTRSDRPLPVFPRPALHSFRLEFPHPMSGELLHFEASLPSDMSKIPLTQKL